MVSYANWQHGQPDTPGTPSAQQLARAKARTVVPKYSMPGEYIGQARQFLPRPTALTPIEQMPEYKGAMSYQFPTSWALPEKPTVDPAQYAKQWELSSGDIIKAFERPGGIYEQRINPLIERGLGSSGELAMRLRDVGSDLATALAQARAGIDISQLQRQSDIDQWYAGLQAQQAAGEQAAAERQAMAGAGAAERMLGLRGERDIYSSQIPFMYGQATFGAAKELADIRNQLLAQQWGQEFQAGQAEWQRKAAERQAENQRLANMLEMLGSYEATEYGESDQGYQDWVVANQERQRMGLPPLPMPEGVKKYLEKKSAPISAQPYNPSPLMAGMQSGGVGYGPSMAGIIPWR